MRPNNEFTSPEVRFFYPSNHPVEFHESLDTAGLPRVQTIPGEDHHVVIGGACAEKYAELTWSSYNIPAKATILGIKGRQKGPGSNLGRHFLEPEESERFDQDCSYAPAEDQEALVIVQVDSSHLQGDIADPRFNSKGVAILPYGTPLPSFAKSKIADEQVRYRLLGFINPEDALVTWQGQTSNTVLLVDWCVANQLKQNRLEEALLKNTLPKDCYLPSMLNTVETAKAYLEYFDNKYGTTYVPEEDSRFPYSESSFAPLSETDSETYRSLVTLALSFITNPR